MRQQEQEMVELNPYGELVAGPRCCQSPGSVVGVSPPSCIWRNSRGWPTGLEPATFGATIRRHPFLGVAGCSELRRPGRLSARLQAALNGVRVVSESPRRDAEGASLPEYPAQISQLWRADERTRTADLLITRKNRRVSGCWWLLQNPLDKPNTPTSNIREQPEIRPGWCTNGVQGWVLIVDDSLGAGIGARSWEMTCVTGAPPPWGLVSTGIYSGWEISATIVRPSTPA